MILAFFAHWLHGMHIWALLVAEPGKACVSEHRFTNDFPVQSNLFNDLSYLPEQPSLNVGSCLGLDVAFTGSAVGRYPDYLLCGAETTSLRPSTR